MIDRAGQSPDHQFRIDPGSLGSSEFRRDHGVRYAYVAGSMYKAVASEEMVIRMGRAGLLSYFGAGGLRPDRLVSAIQQFHDELGDGPFGVNLLASTENPAKEMETVELLLRHGVRRVEAASFVRPTIALVRYRVTGLCRSPDGSVHIPNRVMAKVSRPEVIQSFLLPPPRHLLDQLVEAGHINAEEATLAERIPMADDLCAEADSGGHTDQRPLVTLLPDTIRLRDQAMRDGLFLGEKRIRVGAAGGLGEPAALAAAFVMGADFVLTGSVNQCTVEAGTSEPVKHMLQEASVHDMAMVPAGDMLETGTRAQVLRRGLFYPARANKLYDLYLRHESIEELDERTAIQLQRKFYRRSLDEVWEETRAYYATANPDTLKLAEQDPKLKMLLIFKAYFVQSIRFAMNGDTDGRVDYQINCGPAMGALNGLLRGTAWEDWRHRHVDDIAEFLMKGAARQLSDQLAAYADAGLLATAGRI